MSLDREPVYLSLALLLISGSLFFGCGSPQVGKTIAVSPEPIKEPLTLNLFAARAFLDATEYERYRLVDKYLIRECGAVESGPLAGVIAPEPLDKEAPFLPYDPSLKPHHRRVDLVPADIMKKVETLTRELSSTQTESNPTLPSPGALFSLDQPGILDLKIAHRNEQTEILTSVDAVADSKTAQLTRIRQLFATLRAVGPKICNDDSFFGVKLTH